MIIGLALSLGDQVVEDEVGMALLDPAGLIFAAAVLQIEHRDSASLPACRSPAADRRARAASFRSPWRSTRSRAPRREVHLAADSRLTPASGISMPLASLPPPKKAWLPGSLTSTPSMTKL